ncbi:MAG TPA: hypothetical protein VF043_31980 [Ktedonobacteraceae bacterium]
MQQNTESPLVRVEFQQCVQDLQTCHDVCLQTVDNSIQAGGDHAKPQYIWMLQDCAELCHVTTYFLQHDSPLFGYVTSACAQVTQHCAEECQLMGDTDCANAGQNASWSLEQLSKLI